MAYFLFFGSRYVVAHPRYLRLEVTSISTKDGIPSEARHADSKTVPQRLGCLMFPISSVPKVSRRVAAMAIVDVKSGSLRKSRRT